MRFRRRRFSRGRRVFGRRRSGGFRRRRYGGGGRRVRRIGIRL